MIGEKEEEKEVPPVVTFSEVRDESNRKKARGI
jgi:hypothetical protein